MNTYVGRYSNKEMTIDGWKIVYSDVNPAVGFNEWLFDCLQSGEVVKVCSKWWTDEEWEGARV
jgi:hypothetical protein